MNAWAWAGWWKQCRGAVKVLLGRITHNRLLEFDGQQDGLNGRLQVHGWSTRQRALTNSGKTLMRGVRPRTR